MIFIFEQLLLHSINNYVRSNFRYISHTGSDFRAIVRHQYLGLAAMP